MAASDEDMEAAVLEWVGSFDLTTPPPTSLVDLSDGVVLFEIMAKIDPQLFNMSAIKVDHGGNWVLKENNVKKLSKGLTRWYDDNMNFNLETSDFSVKPHEIAQDSSMQHILQLATVVMTCTFLCSDNRPFIEQIQTLSSDTQQMLAMMSKSIIEATQLSGGARERTFSMSSQDHTDFNAEPLVQQLTAENDRLKDELAKLRAKIDSLTQFQTEIAHENDELKTVISEREKEAAQYKKEQASEQSAVILKVEIDSLRTELYKVDMQRQEAEARADKQAATVNELTKKNDTLSKHATEAAVLRDQLDELKHVAEKLAKSEAAVEKYKQKAEDGAELRRQIKILQQDKEIYMSKQNDLEEAYLQNASKQSTVTTYKEQIADLINKNQELMKASTQADYEAKKLREQVVGLEAERKQQFEQIHTLEGQLRDAELSALSNATGSGSESSGIAAELGQASVITDMKLHLSRLERENKSLRQSGGGEKEALLNSMLDDEKKARESFEQKYKEELETNLHLADTVQKLESQLHELEAKAMTASFKASDDTVLLAQLAERDRDLKTSRGKLLDQEREIAELQRSLSVSKAASEELQKDAIMLRSELALLGKDKQEMLEELKQQYETRMQEHTADLIAQKDKQTEAYATLETKHSELSRDLAALQAANVDLKLQIQTQLHQISSLQADVNSWQSKYTDLLEKGIQQPLATPLDASEHPDILKEKLKLESERVADLINKLDELKKERAALQEDKQNLQIALKKLKTAFEEVKKTTAAPAPTGGKADEAVRSMRNELAAKDAQIKELKDGFDQLFETAKREQKLMALAWYNMSTQLQKAKSQGGAARGPRASWLSKRRAEQEQANLTRPGMSP